MPDDNARPYLEDSIREIKESLSDFGEKLTEHRIELAGRLGCIETTQDGIKEQFVKLNGSVSRNQDRIATMEADREQQRAAVVAVTLATSQQDIQIKKHEKSISSLDSRWTFFRGKTAGIVLVSSGVCWVVFELVKLWVELHWHLIPSVH